VNQTNISFLKGQLYSIEFESLITKLFFKRNLLLIENTDNIAAVFQQTLPQIKITDFNYKGSVYYLAFTKEEPTPNDPISLLWQDGEIYFAEFQTGDIEQHFFVVADSKVTKSELKRSIRNYWSVQGTIQLSSWMDCWLEK
jgi:hypothetical protein